ncbi:S8 family serine peptidase [Thalassotalea sp. Y01]|uniref:S8 family serine peptidase n=1 Tax=Thalassotalea sp. Y01 TaxID=2729613 RepID=UPI00145FACAC|nr:S8 family serine peptidase [Thalassotalea sp. Y01]NMP15952.1 S8 family serine peptidase [Thalassotalea sp. Y01]
MNTKKFILAAGGALYVSSAMAATQVWDIDKTQLPAHLLESNQRQQVEIPATAVSTTNNVEAKVNRFNGMPSVNNVVNQQIIRSQKFSYDPTISGEHEFVVVLAEQPVAAYKGGVAGLAATHLKTFAQQQHGSTIQANGKPAVTDRATLKAMQNSSEYQRRIEAYQNYLLASQQQIVDAAAKLGVSINTNFQYTNAVNGFTTVMTQEQAQSLAQLSSVVSISPVRTFQLQELVNSELLGSSEVINVESVWNAWGYKGEGMIVGVADTGINASSASFAEVGADGYVHTNPFGDGNFLGDCATAEWRHLCNNKLVGIYSYEEITSYYRSQIAHQITENRGKEVDLSNDGMIRPATGIDYIGHGSHTGGIAAGNYVKDVDFLYRQLLAGPGIAAMEEPVGDLSGIAPHANVISYQVCLPGGGGDALAGCLETAMISALEKAVIDGIDVLNWSIGGGSRDPWGDPILLGFLSLKEHGIHVTAAAGNTGGYEQVSNVTPWSLSVGATSLGRNNENVGSATLLYSTDGEDFDSIDLGGERAYSISGGVQGVAVLGADMGECINFDCSPAPVCEEGSELIDGLCYLQCAEGQRRNNDTLECERLSTSNPGSGDDSGACLIGETMTPIGCVADHVSGPVSWESICEGQELAVYPSLGNDAIQQAFICPTIKVEDCAVDHRPFSGESAKTGRCCAYGVIDNTDVADQNIWPGEPHNIYDSFHGACHGPSGGGFLSQGNLTELEYALEAAGQVDKTMASVASSTPTEDVTVQQETVIGSLPLQKIFAGDPYCLDFDSWKDPNDPSADFDFTDKVLVCGRGDDTVKDNKPRINKAKDAFYKNAAGMVMYNTVKEYPYNARFASALNFPVYADDEQTEIVDYQNFPYIHVGNATWRKGIGRRTLRQKFIENDALYLEIGSVQKSVSYDPKRIRDLAGFSSKGPNKHYPSLMGPSIVAPGENILAPYTNDSAFTTRANSAEYAFDTGTSMAAPHMAGVMALLAQVRGDEWTAAERESAAMLTAGVVTGGSWLRIDCSGLDIVNNQDFTDYNQDADVICPEYDADNIFHQEFVFEAPYIDKETGEYARDEEDKLLLKVFKSYFERQGTRPWEAGSGLVNVDAALNSGLIMDETHENYLAADPTKGGDLTQLNLPYLFNGACHEECYFTRTFTSTVAGDNTWVIDIENSEESIELTASKSSFTLRKGESVTIFFTARIKRSTSASSDGSGMVDGMVNLIPQTPGVVSAHLPVGIALTPSRLPLMGHGSASEDVGQFPLNGIAPWGSSDDLQANIYQQGGVSYVKTDNDGHVATTGAGQFFFSAADFANGSTIIGQTELTVDQSPDHGDLTQEAAEFSIEEDSLHLIWVDVPANSKLLAIDILEHVSSSTEASGNPADIWKRGDLLVVVGRDNDDNQELDYKQEGMCVSSTELSLNHCLIHNPEPGKYWIHLQNVGTRQFNTVKDTFKYAVSVIGDETSSAMAVVAPDSYQGTQAMTLDVTYDIKLNQGDAVYGFVELGTSENNLDNLGAIPVKLTRGADAFTVEVSDTEVKAGNYVRVDVNYAPNHTGYQRTFALDVEFPDGLTYIPYSVGGDPRFVTGYSEQGGNLTISGYQPNSYRLLPFYQISSNVDPSKEEFENHPLAAAFNAQCKTPPVGGYIDGSSPNGGYIDLARLNPRMATPPYGSENPDKMTSWRDQIRVNTQQLFGYGTDADFNLYNAPNAYHELRISPMGYIDSGVDYPLFGVPYADPFTVMHFLPDIRLGPLMVGSFDTQLTTGKKAPEDALQADDAEGITLAAFMSRENKNLIIEWDNAYTIKGDRYNFGSEGTPQGDSFDFMAMIDLEYSYEMGSYELIYAYDNIQTTHNKGSIGLHGMAGLRTTFGPVGGYRNRSVGYNNIDQLLHDNLVICFDYIGDDYSKSNFNFWVKVEEGYAGEQIDFTVKTKLDRMTKSVTNTLNVAGNLTIRDIDDVVINQGERIEILVIYNDLANSVNEITVQSDSIMTELSGHTPGSILTIDASCDFAGTTEVLVTVADMDNTDDKASTSFLVNVQQVNGFTANADCSANGESESETESGSDSLELKKESGSSGGSIALLSLLLLLLSASVRINVKQ